MKVKKVCAVLLTTVLALSLAACGGSSAKSTETEVKSSANSTAAEAESIEEGKEAEGDNASEEPEQKAETTEGKGGEEYVLKCYIGVAETDPIGVTALKFKELVEERTDGRVVIEVYPSGTLGECADCLEGQKLRICDIVFNGISNLAAYDELANLSDAHYMFRDLDHYYKVFDGEIGQEYLKTLGEKTDKALLGYMCSGARQLTTTKPVRTPADLKGLKMRTPNVPIYTDSWTWLGASPIPLAGSEIYTSLNQHIIDGQENPYPTCTALSVQEVCKYVTETNHAFCTLSFIMDKEFYEGMPEDIRTILMDTANEVGKWGTDYAFSVAEEKKQEMIDAGCEIFDIDVAEWQTAMDGFLEEKYPELAEWADKIIAVE